MSPVATVATVATPQASPQPLISDAVALSLIGVGLSVFIGVLGFLFKRTIADIDQKITIQAKEHEDLEEKIRALETAHLTYQITAGEAYVRRADFITRIALIDGQLEKIAVGVQQNQGLIYAIRERETK